MCGSVTADTGVHLIHCANSVIAVFGKMSSLAASKNTCGRISNSPCSLTHGLFLSPCPCSAFAFGVPLALVTLSFAFALALSFGLTFALDDSTNFHVVGASIPGFIRAQVTLDRLYHFLAVNANFF